MTAPVPPPGAPNPGAAQAPAPAAATATATAANLPPGLANLAAGAILQGTVTATGAQGQVVIQTPNGVLSLATALALPPGGKVALQVQSAGAQIQFTILSVNGQPVANAAAAAARISAPPLPPAPAASAAAPAAGGAAQAAGGAAPLQSPAVLVSAGRALTATLVQPALTSGNPAAGQAQAPGLPLSAAPAAPAAPLSSPATVPVPSAIPAGTPPQEALQILSALFARPGRAPAAAQKGAQLPVRIAGFESNPQADPQNLLRAAAQARPGAQLLAGTVTSQSGSQLQVATALGQLAVGAKLGLPPQSQIVFEVLGPLQPPPAAELPATGAVAHGRGWPALEEALAVLARQNPAQFRQVSDSMSPRTEAGVAKMIALTAAAMKSGDLAALMGERAMQALAAAGRQDLVNQLTQDLRQLAMPAHDASGGEWRSYLIPVHDGGQLNYIRMHARRRQKQKQDGQDSGSAARFIVEVDLSRLGAMQFDGLVKAKQFDLVIRSRMALDSAMRRDIGQIFSDSTATSGLMGSVSFQAGERFAQVPARAAATPTGLDV